VEVDEENKGEVLTPPNTRGVEENTPKESPYQLEEDKL